MASASTGTWSRLLARAGERLLLVPRSAYVLVALSWAGLVWFSSSHQGSSEPGNFLWSVLGNLAHAPLFGLLALWLALAAPRRSGWADLTPMARLVILLIVLAWGLTDEWHQSWVEGRTASVLDLCTDVVGAAVTLDVAKAAGDPQISEGSLRWRLVRGLAACALCALAATIGF